MASLLIMDLTVGWKIRIPLGRRIQRIANIKDTVLGINLKLHCGICTNWRMRCIP